MPAHAQFIVYNPVFVYYRPGFNIVEACGVASGSYIITARTYNDQDEGPFFISTSSDHVFCFERLHP